jgi:hypothetical protein
MKRQYYYKTMKPNNGREGGFCKCKRGKKIKIPQKIYSVPKVGNESGH